MDDVYVTATRHNGNAVVTYEKTFKEDLTGKKFGKWHVIEYARTINSKTHWKCRCECGVMKDIEGYNLKSGRSVSCRRCSAKNVGDMLREHNMRGTKVWRTWLSIKTRCNNPRQAKAYRYYGAKGVRVCDEWMKSFHAFYDHIGDPPTPEHSIDRIDPFGNYEPGNVRWATHQQQMANLRSSPQHAAKRAALKKLAIFKK